MTSDEEGRISVCSGEACYQRAATLGRVPARQRRQAARSTATSAPAPARRASPAMTQATDGQAAHRPPGRPPSRPRACCPCSEVSAGSAAKHRGELGQPALVALDELCLELDEPIDDPRADDDVDLVEAQLDPRVAVAQDPLAAKLADRHELDQRRVAGQLQDQRPGVRRGPLDAARRSDRPVPRAPRDGPIRRRRWCWRAT